MDQRCDGCGARTQYRYARGDDCLTLCGHHGRQHGQALRLAGWFAFRLVELASVST